MFYFISKNGDGIGLLQRLTVEGRKSSLELVDKSSKDLAKGAYKRSTSLPVVEDTIVFDSVGLGERADRFIDRGFNVIGGSSDADRLELDRVWGMEVMEAIDISVPPFFPFKDVGKAVSFVKKVKKPFAIKPLSNELFTTVPKDWISCASALERYKKQGEISKGLVLQELVEGDEISTEGWFEEGKYIEGSANHTIEEKKFLAGNLGPQVGCVSSMVWKTKRKAWMSKIGEYLPKYVGPVDLNCIVDKKGVWWGLEWTPRFGYSAIYALAELLENPLHELLGQRTINLSDGYAFALRVSIPPYPTEFPKRMEELRSEVYATTRGLDIGKIPNKKHTWLLDYMMEGDKLVVAGVDGVVMELTSRAQTPERAVRWVYSMAEGLTLKNKQYRIDAPQRAIKYIREKGKTSPAPSKERSDKLQKGQEEPPPPPLAAQ